MRSLLDAWTTTPALIHGRWMDVLASNPLARALTPLSEPGTNMLRSVFLNPDVRARYVDPDWASATVVAYLRASVGDDAGNPELNHLVGELSLASEAFRTLWAQHDVQSALSGNAPLVHPVVGEMNLNYQTFTVDGADRQTLMVVHTAPGSPDAKALARLADLDYGAAQLHGLTGSTHARVVEHSSERAVAVAAGELDDWAPRRHCP